MMRSTVLFLAGLMPATCTGLKRMYSHLGGVGGDLGDVGGPPCYPILDLDTQGKAAHDDNIVFMDRLALGEWGVREQSGCVSQVVCWLEWFLLISRGEGRFATKLLRRKADHRCDICWIERDLLDVSLTCDLQL